MAIPVTAIILAAGYSTRYGVDNKMLAPLKGKPVLWHVLSSIKTLDLADMLVVTNTHTGSLNELCAARGVRVVVNEQARDGMGRSIACGVSAIGNKSHAMMITLGDMPFIAAKTYDLVMQTHHHHGHDKSVIFPATGQKRGHPVIFGPAYRSALSKLTGDQGAQTIVTGNRTQWRSVEVHDDGIFRDIDRPSDLDANS